jgi:large subunit ribosomal protein L6
MSKVWKNPITVPHWVLVTINGDVVDIQGPKWKLWLKLSPGITGVLHENIITLSCGDEELRKYRGTMRSIMAHMIKWVSEGYTKTLQVIGVWFDATLQGNVISFKLWFSHPVLFNIPTGIEVKIEKDPKWNTLINLASHDKQLIGQVASKIRWLKKPEPYKGKGIRFLWEVIKLKAGKAAKK